MDITDTRRMAVLAAVIAEEKKGRDIRIVNFEGVSDLYDYAVIISAISTRETKAIAGEIDFVIKNFPSGRRIVQGMDNGCWVLLDYGGIVIHVFAENDRASVVRGLRPRIASESSNYREFYKLEELWNEMPVIDLENEESREEMRTFYFDFLKNETAAKEARELSNTGLSELKDEDFEDGVLYDEE